MKSTRPISSFPNDLLRELDRMNSIETQQTVRAKTGRSSSSLEQREELPGCLPAPLLLPLHQASRTKRPCTQIVDVHYPKLKQDCCAKRWNRSSTSRVPGIKKKPSTSGTARLAQTADGRKHSGRCAEEPGAEDAIPPLHGALLKTSRTSACSNA